MISTLKLVQSILDNIDAAKTNDAASIDLTTKEGIKECDELIESFRNNPFTSMFITDSDLDTIKEAAHKVYENSNKTTSTRKVIDNTEASKPEPYLPSSKTPEEIQVKISNLANEYVDTMIKPYINEDKHKMIDDAKRHLFEFGCWVYNK